MAEISAPRLLRKCRKCKRVRFRSEFRTEDRNGIRGWAGRCATCRSASHKHGPLWLLRSGGPRFRVRSHSVIRYIERVRPGLKFNDARLEMCERMADAPLIRPGEEGLPEWLSEKDTSHSLHRGMLVVDPDTVFCLSARHPRSKRAGEIYVSTVLTRAGSRAHSAREQQPLAG